MRDHYYLSIHCTLGTKASYYLLTNLPSSTKNYLLI